MMDTLRRNLLGGAILTGAAFGFRKAAQAQTSSALRPPEMATPPQMPSVQTSDDDRDPTRAALRTPVVPAVPVKSAGQDWANLRRYARSNIEVKSWALSERRVVMMGDSITDNWPGLAGDFYVRNSLVGRGISGQTTAQMVVRFGAEVIDLKPAVVHILAGTNDIAENLDPYDFDQTTRNIRAMTDMARANGIRVVIGSVPPATSFSWRPERGNPAPLILALNDWIYKHCKANGFAYADYWQVLAGTDGGLKPELGLDSVHPNAAGYVAMGPVALAAIARVAKHA